MKIKSHNDYGRADFLALLLNLAIYNSNFDSVISNWEPFLLNYPLVFFDCWLFWSQLFGTSRYFWIIFFLSAYKHQRRLFRTLLIGIKDKPSLQFQIQYKNRPLKDSKNHFNKAVIWLSGAKLYMKLEILIANWKSLSLSKSTVSSKIGL